MLIDHSGKTALVTASGSGIGHAIAHGLAVSGAHVAINSRSQATVDVACDKLAKAVPQARLSGHPGNLSDPGQTEALLDTLPGVDILINNAGIFGLRDFFETDDAEWNRYWQTNELSSVRLCTFT